MYMSDFYTEQLVKKRTSGKDIMIKTLLIAVTVLSFLLIPVLPFFIFIPVLLIVLDYFMFRRLDLEYEYLYVNGDLDIDKIMAKQKRKRIFSMNINDLELLAPLGAGELNQYHNAKVLDYSSQMPDARRYAMIVTSKGEQVKVIFEPEQVILDGMRMLAPRKVIL